MSKGGGGSSGGSSTTTVQPPQYMVPYISEFLKLIGGAPGGPGGYPSGGLYNETYQQAGFPNQQVAPLNSQEQQGLNLATSEANAFGGVTGAGLQEALKTLQGGYLTPPPAVQDAINRQTMMEYNQSAAPSEMSAAAQAGAFGGSADAEARGMGQFNLTTALSDSAMRLYEQERQNQITTAADLPKIGLAAQMPSEQLLQAGGFQQAQNQSELTALYNNLFNAANFPFLQAQSFGGALGTAGGGSGTTTQTGSGGGPSGLTMGLGLGGLGLLGASQAGLLGSGGLATAGSTIGTLLPLLAAFL